jgi:DNA-binding NarL/FixJ family response regulator
MVKILLAEGNVQLRTLIKALIETRKDFTVCGEANNGVEAISKTVQLKPDLVILDFAMNGLNGLQVGSQLSKTFPDLPIILHTFHGSIPRALALASVSGEVSACPSLALRQRVL